MESKYTQQQMRSDRLALSRLPSVQVGALWVSLSRFPSKYLGEEGPRLMRTGSSIPTSKELVLPSHALMTEVEDQPSSL